MESDTYVCSLQMETEEGPDEKKQGLAEFLEAMLPSTSSCIQQGADQSKLKTKGAQREHFAKGQKVAWLVDNIWDAWISWGQESSQWPEAEGTDDKEVAGADGEEEKEFGAWLTERMWGLGLDAEVCAPYVMGLLELDEVSFLLGPSLLVAQSPGAWFLRKFRLCLSLFIAKPSLYCRSISYPWNVSSVCLTSRI